MTSTSTTSEAVPASKTDTSRPARTPRRSPADLPFRFANEALVRQLVAERGEPDWLLTERLTAAAAFEALLVESNQLYTPYVDLRGAILDQARPWVRTASEPDEASAELPDGVDGLIDLREDVVVALALSPAAAAAGVTLETFGAAIARDPDGFRADIEGGATLPADDKLAQLARGFWSQGVRLVVPAHVHLAHPILIRWGSGNPERDTLGTTAWFTLARATMSVRTTSA